MEEATNDLDDPSAAADIADAGLANFLKNLIFESFIDGLSKKSLPSTQEPEESLPSFLKNMILDKVFETKRDKDGDAAEAEVSKEVLDKILDEELDEADKEERMEIEKDLELHDRQPEDVEEVLCTPDVADSSDENDEGAVPAKEKTAVVIPFKKVAKVMLDSHILFAERQDADARRITPDPPRRGPPKRLAIPVTKPLPAQGPTKPDQIQYYIGIDKVDKNLLRSKKKMSKENLINDAIMMTEALQMKTKKEFGENGLPEEHERSVNPYVRARENLKLKHASIYRPTDGQLNKGYIRVLGVGTEEDNMQYNIVEHLNADLKPTGNRRYLHSTEIIPVIAKTREEELLATIRDLEKTVRNLQKGADKSGNDESAKAKSAKDDLDATAEPVRVGEYGDDPHYSSSAGEGNPKIKAARPEECHLCGRRYKNKHTLAQHMLESHGGKDGGPKGKHCDDCGEDFPNLNKYYRHSCSVAKAEERKRKRAEEDKESGKKRKVVKKSKK